MKFSEFAERGKGRFSDLRQGDPGLSPDEIEQEAAAELRRAIGGAGQARSTTRYPGYGMPSDWITDAPDSGDDDEDRPRRTGDDERRMATDLAMQQLADRPQGRFRAADTLSMATGDNDAEDLRNRALADALERQRRMQAKKAKPAPPEGETSRPQSLDVHGAQSRVQRVSGAAISPSLTARPTLIGNRPAPEDLLTITPRNVPDPRRAPARTPSADRSKGTFARAAAGIKARREGTAAPAETAAPSPAREASPTPAPAREASPTPAPAAARASQPAQATASSRPSQSGMSGAWTVPSPRGGPGPGAGPGSRGGPGPRSGPNSQTTPAPTPGRGPAERPSPPAAGDAGGAEPAAAPPSPQMEELEGLLSRGTNALPVVARWLSDEVDASVALVRSSGDVLDDFTAWPRTCAIARELKEAVKEPLDQASTMWAAMNEKESLSSQDGVLVMPDGVEAEGCEWLVVPFGWDSKPLGVAFLTRDEGETFADATIELVEEVMDRLARHIGERPEPREPAVAIGEPVRTEPPVALPDDRVEGVRTEAQAGADTTPAAHQPDGGPGDELALSDELSAALRVRLTPRPSQPPASPKAPAAEEPAAKLAEEPAAPLAEEPAPTIQADESGAAIEAPAAEQEEPGAEQKEPALPLQDEPASSLQEEPAARLEQRQEIADAWRQHLHASLSPAEPSPTAPATPEQPSDGQRAVAEHGAQQASREPRDDGLSAPARDRLIALRVMLDAFESVSVGTSSSYDAIVTSAKSLRAQISGLLDASVGRSSANGRDG